MALSSVVACLVVLAVAMGVPASARLLPFNTRGAERGLPVELGLDSIKHIPVQEAFEELEKVGSCACVHVCVTVCVVCVCVCVCVWCVHVLCVCGVCAWCMCVWCVCVCVCVLGMVEL